MSIYYTDDWVNAQQMHIEHPDTFDVPDKGELEGVVEGFTVKISNGEERFWVEIIEKGEGYYLAKIDNNLVGSRGYNYGDIVKIEPKNIYEIHTTDDRNNIIKEMKNILENSDKNPNDVELAEKAAMIRNIMKEYIDNLRNMNR